MFIKSVLKSDFLVFFTTISILVFSHILELSIAISILKESCCESVFR